MAFLHVKQPSYIFWATFSLLSLSQGFEHSSQLFMIDKDRNVVNPDDESAFTCSTRGE